MKTKIPVLFFMILAIGCNSKIGDINKINEEADACEQSRYNLFTHKYPSYTEWKIEYMDYISFCLDDSATAVQLAQMDAKREDYTFIIYGLIGNMEPFESIYRKYPIGFHSPGCESSDIGEIYNQALVKELKSNMNLDYDSIMNDAFNIEE